MAIGQPTTPVRTLRIAHVGPQACEIRDDISGFNVTMRTEVMAIWGAVTAAEEMAKSGLTVRVVVNRNGKDFEEFVARPPRSFPLA